MEVVGAAVDAAKGVGERTAVQASEEAYIIFLLAYVVVIFAAGILLSSMKQPCYIHYCFNTIYG